MKETAELTADDEGELVFVAGRVREVKPPKPVPVAKKLICKACGAKVVYEDRQPRRCPRCGESKLAVETEYDTVQTLKLDHIFVIFGQPWIPLKLRLGDRIIVVGVLKIKKNKFWIDALGFQSWETRGGEKAEPSQLEHLTEIENPSLVGRKVQVLAVVSSNAVPFYVPCKVKTVSGELYLEPDDPRQLKLIGVSDDTRAKRLRYLVGSEDLLAEEEFRTLYLVRIRPPVFTLEEKGERIVDERGFEYKSYDIYIASDRKLTLPPSTKVIIEGIVLPDPRTQKATLLGYRIAPVEEEANIDFEKLRRLKGKLDGFKTIDDKVDWYLNNWRKFSNIINRDNIALACFLTFFSPTWVILDGDVERGWIILVIIGDTTTGKSKTVRKMIALLRGGMMITAELASMAGLLGAATQTSSGGWFVDFGFLVTNDRKLLAIDGAHKLPPQLWAEAAEAERKGVVTIAKAGKESAYARTRQIRICNPLEYLTKRTQSLDAFFYTVEALRSVFDDVSIARTDLAVFAREADVQPEDVNKPNRSNPEPEFFHLEELLKWAWAENHSIEWDPEAYELLLKEATALYHEYHSNQVPLVSIDMKWKLARLAIALARLTCSVSDDFSKVIVKPEHVKYVVDFIRKEYDAAGLKALALAEKREKMTEEDAENILRALEERLAPTGITLEKICNILEFIARKGHVTRGELQEKFELAEKNQLRPLLDILKSESLIKAGKGFVPTPKLIQLLKLLPRLPSLPYSEGYPPRPSDSNSVGGETSKEGGGISSRLANLVTLANEDTELRLICSRCLEDVRRTSIFMEVVDHRSGLGDCEFCAEKSAEFIIRVRKGGW